MGILAALFGALLGEFLSRRIMAKRKDTNIVTVAEARRELRQAELRLQPFELPSFPENEVRERARRHSMQSQRIFVVFRYDARIRTTFDDTIPEKPPLAMVMVTKTLGRANSFMNTLSESANVRYMVGPVLLDGKIDALFPDVQGSSTQATDR